jgi:putative ABC transport system substrate-binding protein
MCTGRVNALRPAYAEFFLQATRKVNRIFKGLKAADLPVEQPTKYDLTINMKIARTLGVTVPQSLLPRADGVIQ